jgi:hypothetical protein
MQEVRRRIHIHIHSTCAVVVLALPRICRRRRRRGGGEGGGGGQRKRGGEEEDTPKQMRVGMRECVCLCVFNRNECVQALVWVFMLVCVCVYWGNGVHVI